MSGYTAWGRWRLSKSGRKSWGFSIILLYVVCGDIAWYAGAGMSGCRIGKFWTALCGERGGLSGRTWKGVDSVYRGLVGQGLVCVLSEESHPLHHRLAGQESRMGSGRLRLPLLRTNRYRDFFTIRAIRLGLHNERVAWVSLSYVYIIRPMY